MPNSTREYWDVNGVSLHQYAWAIKTLGGSRSSLPLLRGEDIKYAYIAGAQFRPKVPDSRVITLVMWVLGVDPDAPEDSNAVCDPDVQYNINFRALKRLFWVPDKPVALTRRWLEHDEDGLPKLLVATASAQIAGTMEPTMTGRTRSDFAVDLMLANPYFYSPERSVTLLRDDVVTIVNDGDDALTGYACYIDLVGPLTNPVVKITSTIPEMYVKFNGSVSAGATVTLRCAEFRAVHSVGTDLVAQVIHSGSRLWVPLQRGSNTVVLTATAGSGHAVYRYKVPYV